MFIIIIIIITPLCAIFLQAHRDCNLMSLYNYDAN